MPTSTRKKYPPRADNFVVRKIGKYQSHFACPVCHTPARLYQVGDIRGRVAVYCNNNTCFTGTKRTQFHFSNAATVLRPGYYKIARNLDKMLRMDWYHISRLSPGMLEFETGKDMHIGQIDTIREYHEISQYRWTDGYYLYRLRFKPDTVLHNEIIRDDNRWETVNDILRNNYDEQGHAVDAYAYVNRWEALGSISMVSRRDKLELVDVYKNVDLNTIQLPF